MIRPGAIAPRLAIIPWGLVVEDFLGPNRLSLEAYLTDFTGSWFFGYDAALRAAGASSVIVCFSIEVPEVIRRRHRATGAQICVIPAPRRYRTLRAHTVDPYGRSVEQVFGPIAPAGGLSKPALFALKELGPYLATPARAMARELRRYGCRAILCQEYEFPRFDVAVAIGRMLRMPVYSSFQGGDYRRWALERITRPVAMRLAAGVIVPSSAERERVHAVYGAVNVAQIPNPVDLETWRPSDRAAARKRLGITADAPVAAWHGRVDIRKKGLDTLVDAWAILEAASPELVPTLLLIGTGADAPQLHRRIAERKLRNVVWIEDYLHRPGAIAELLSAADLYVFPSRHEGFPVAPIEAMACGLGLISADVSGVRDVLAGGESAGGLIVPRADPQRLADQLGRLLREPVRCRRLGRQARSTAARFGRSAIGLQLRDFLLAPGAPR